MPEVNEPARNTNLCFVRINVPHDPVPDFIAKARKGDGNITILIRAIDNMIARDPAGNAEDVQAKWEKYGVPGGENQLIAEYYAAVTSKQVSQHYPGM